MEITPITPAIETKRRPTWSYRVGAVAALLVGMSALTAACGGGSGSPSAQGANAQGQGGSAQGSQQAVAFAQCVRSHGVPSFPDPQNGHFLISGSVQNSPQFQAATQACQHLLPNGLNSGSGSSGGSSSAALLKFAQCMRSQGITNFPDPSSNGALGLPPGSGIDPNSPQFQSAWQACQSNLPPNLQGQQP